MNSNTLLYSVQTQSFEPSSTDALAHEYGQKIIQNMVKSNILQKQEDKMSKSMQIDGSGWETNIHFVLDKLR